METQKIGAEELLAHSGWLRGLAAALVGNAAAADDLVQETWLRALRHPPRADRPVRPWLARLARNLARSQARSRRARAAHEQGLAEPPPERASDEVVEEIEAQALVVQALLALDEPLRTALALRYYRGLDSPEIARLTGSAPSTVRWRIQRGLDELRSRLDRKFHGERGAWIALLAPLGRRATEPLTASTVVVSGWQLAQRGAVAALVLVLAGWLGWSVWLRPPRPSGSPAIGEAHPTPVAAPVADHDAASVRDADSGERTAVIEGERRETPPPSAAPASAQVELRCIDPFGRPLAGVQLLEQDSQRVSGASGGDGLARCTVPAPDGERAWWAWLVAAKPGHAARLLRAVLHAGTSTNLGEIVLEEGGAAAGRVLDPAGRPIAGARVGAMEIPSQPSSRRWHLRGPSRWSTHPLAAMTDGAGRFRLEGLPPGPLQVWAKASDTTYGVSTVIEVTGASVAHGVEVVLAPFAPQERIRGIVLDPAGRPVPRAEIGASHRGGGERLEADVDGRFELVTEHEVIAGKEVVFTLVAQDPERRHAAASRSDVRPGAEDVVLQLGDPPRIELTVVDPDGRPVEHYSTSPAAARGSFVPWGVDSEHPEGESSLAVPDASSTFVVRANGYGPVPLGPWEPERLPRELVVALEPTRSGGLVRGGVVASGVPVAGAEVALFPSAPDGSEVYGDEVRCKFKPFEAVQGRTDAEGRFLLAFERAGTFWVRAVDARRAPALAGPLHLDPTRPDEDIELTLSTGGVIEGRVVAGHGIEPAGAIVLANCGDGLPRSQRAGWGGTFRFGGLTPGRWQVSLKAEDLAPSFVSTTVQKGSSPFEWNCTVAEGETTYVELELPVAETCALSGRLALGGGDLGGWLASLRRVDGSAAAQAMGRAHSALELDGSFRLEVAGAGRYQLLLVGLVDPGTTLRLFETLELAPGEQAWLADLALGYVAGVAGAETLRSGGGVTCTAEPRSGLWCRTMVRPDTTGRFAFAFPVGRVLLESDADPDRSRVEVDLAPGVWIEARLP
jgi:RNA polymerase sigma-70 factor (ECF subfamily)